MVELAGLVVKSYGTPDSNPDEIWSIVGDSGDLKQPAARSAQDTGHLSEFARASQEAQDRHLMMDHHIPASLVKAYRREEHGRLETVGSYSKALRLHQGMHTESGGRPLARRFGLTGEPEMDTPHLDKVLALASDPYEHAPHGEWNRGMDSLIRQAGGRTRDYERVVHGREEHVSGHLNTHPLGQLREMAGQRADEHDWLRTASDLDRGISEPDRQEIVGHIGRAYEAHRAGQHGLAHTHLINAKNKSIYSGGRALQSAIRGAIAHQSNLAAGEPLPSMRHVQGLASRNEPLGWNPAR